MNIRASGRAALVIAAGLWICTSAPLHATENDAPASEPAAAVGSATDTSAEPTKAAKHRSPRKTEAKSRKSDRQATKGSRKPTEDDTAKAEDAKPEHDTAIPASLANANAQWPSETTATNTYNMTSQAGSALGQIGGQQEQPAATTTPDSGPSNAQLVAADQLNDLDRAISEDKPPLTLAKATIDTPAPEVVASEGSTSWDKTSLVGKIFIAFGGLLTMASAARMFMA
jgi:hypothetical protein